jgi:tetratricopeptide (TPR) repeat protein
MSLIKSARLFFCKNHLSVLLQLTSLCATATILSACSSENVFELADQPDDKKKGESALANGDYGEAIKSLESALRDNPNDPELRKMLASAYLSKSGVDTLKIVQQISAAEGKTDWGAMVSALPGGTVENQSNLKRAVEVLDAIPESQRSSEERYQLAMAQTSLAVVTAKKYGADESGKVPAERVSEISDDDASIIVTQLEGASGNLAGLEDSNASKGAGKIQSVATKIAESPGDTDGDRVRSFLAQGQP